MDMVLRNELALAFSAPVNVNEVPGYSDLIKYPMDLGTIKVRLSRGYYDQRFEMLVRDVNLVWENCFTFNRLDADISKCANRLRCKCPLLVCQCYALRLICSCVCVHPQLSSTGYSSNGSRTCRLTPL